MNNLELSFYSSTTSYASTDNNGLMINRLQSSLYDTYEGNKTIYKSQVGNLVPIQESSVSYRQNDGSRVLIEERSPHQCSNNIDNYIQSKSDSIPQNVPISSFCGTPPLVVSRNISELDHELPHELQTQMSTISENKEQSIPELPVKQIEMVPINNKTSVDILEKLNSAHSLCENQDYMLYTPIESHNSDTLSASIPGYSKKPLMSSNSTPLICNTQSLRRLTEREIRYAFKQEWRKQLYNDKKFADEMYLLSILSKSVYLCEFTYTLESRSLRWDERPFDANNDVDTEENGLPPSMWSLSVPLPSDSFDHTYTKKISHTDTIDICPDCKGQGHIYCKQCDTPTLYTEYKLNSSSSSSTIPPKLATPPLYVCNNCQNKKYTFCKRCQGTGKIVHYVLMTIIQHTEHINKSFMCHSKEIEVATSTSSHVSMSSPSLRSLDSTDNTIQSSFSSSSSLNTDTHSPIAIDSIPFFIVYSEPVLLGTVEGNSIDISSLKSISSLTSIYNDLQHDIENIALDNDTIIIHQSISLYYKPFIQVQSRYEGQDVLFYIYGPNNKCYLEESTPLLQQCCSIF
ncbi:hypothetical protein WA158_003859 [Blastocystis sp. Blastoise]